MLRTKLNAREAKFVEGLAHGLKKGEAAAAAGYSVHSAPEQASRLLTRPHILSALREAAERQITAGVAIGAKILVELAESARSEDVRLRAAQALLAHSGLAPVTRHETKHVI